MNCSTSQLHSLLDNKTADSSVSINAAEASSTSGNAALTELPLLLQCLESSTKSNVVIHSPCENRDNPILQSIIANAQVNHSNAITSTKSSVSEEPSKSDVKDTSLPVGTTIELSDLNQGKQLLTNRQCNGSYNQNSSETPVSVESNEDDEEDKETQQKQLLLQEQRQLQQLQQIQQPQPQSQLQPPQKSQPLPSAVPPSPQQQQQQQQQIQQLQQKQLQRQQHQQQQNQPQQQLINNKQSIQQPIPTKQSQQSTIQMSQEMLQQKQQQQQFQQQHQNMQLQLAQQQQHLQRQPMPHHQQQLQLQQQQLLQQRQQILQQRQRYNSQQISPRQRMSKRSPITSPVSDEALRIDLMHQPKMSNEQLLQLRIQQQQKQPQQVMQQQKFQSNSHPFESAKPEMPKSVGMSSIDSLLFRDTGLSDFSSPKGNISVPSSQDSRLWSNTSTVTTTTPTTSSVFANFMSSENSHSIFGDHPKSGSDTMNWNQQFMRSFDSRLQPLNSCHTSPTVSMGPVSFDPGRPNIQSDNVGDSHRNRHPSSVVSNRPSDEKVITHPEGSEPRVPMELPDLMVTGAYSFEDCSYNPLPAYDLFYILINPHSDYSIETNTLYCLCPEGNKESFRCDSDMLKDLGSQRLKAILNESDYNKVMEKFKQQLNEYRTTGKCSKQHIRLVCGSYCLVTHLFPAFLDGKPNSAAKAAEAIDSERYLMGWLSSCYKVHLKHGNSGGTLLRSPSTSSRDGSFPRSRRASGVKANRQSASSVNSAGLTSTVGRQQHSRVTMESTMNPVHLLQTQQSASISHSQLSSIRNSSGMSSTAFLHQTQPGISSAANSQQQNVLIQSSHQLQGLQSNQQLQGFQPNQQIQGLQSNQQLQGFQSNQQLQGLQNNQQLQGLQNSQQLQGLQNSQQLQGLQNSQQLQGLQNSQQLQGLQNSQQLQSLQSNQQLQGIQNNQQLQGLQSNQQLQGLQSNQQLQGLQNSQQLQGIQNNQQLQGLQTSQHLQGLQNNPHLQSLQNNPQLQGLQSNQQLQGLQNSQQLQGLQSSQQLQGRQNNPQLQGLQNNPQLQGLQSNQQLQSLQNNPQLQGLQSNPQIQGMQSNPQIQPLQSNQQLQGLQNNTLLQGIPNIPTSLQQSMAGQQNSQLQRIGMTISSQQGLASQPTSQLQSLTNISASIPQGLMSQPHSDLQSLTTSIPQSSQRYPMQASPLPQGIPKNNSQTHLQALANSGNEQQGLFSQNLMPASHKFDGFDFGPSGDNWSPGNDLGDVGLPIGPSPECTPQPNNVNLKNTITSGLQEKICESTRNELALLHQGHMNTTDKQEKERLKQEIMRKVAHDIGRNKFHSSTREFMLLKQKQQLTCPPPAPPVSAAAAQTTAQSNTETRSELVSASVSAADSCNGPFPMPTSSTSQAAGGVARSPDAEGQSPQTGPGLLTSPREDPTSTTSPEGQSSNSGSHAPNQAAAADTMEATPTSSKSKALWDGGNYVTSILTSKTVKSSVHISTPNMGVAAGTNSLLIQLLQPPGEPDGGRRQSCESMASSAPSQPPIEASNGVSLLDVDALFQETCNNTRTEGEPPAKMARSATPMEDLLSTTLMDFRPSANLPELPEIDRKVFSPLQVMTATPGDSVQVPGEIVSFVLEHEAMLEQSKVEDCRRRSELELVDWKGNLTRRNSDRVSTSVSETSTTTTSTSTVPFNMALFPSLMKEIPPNMAVQSAFQRSPASSSGLDLELPQVSPTLIQRTTSVPAPSPAPMVMQQQQQQQHQQQHLHLQQQQQFCMPTAPASTTNSMRSTNQYRYQMDTIARGSDGSQPVDKAGTLFRKQLSADCNVGVGMGAPGRRGVPCRQTEVVVHRPEIQSPVTPQCPPDMYSRLRRHAMPPASPQYSARTPQSPAYFSPGEAATPYSLPSQVQPRVPDRPKILETLLFDDKEDVKDEATPSPSHRPSSSASLVSELD